MTFKSKIASALAVGALASAAPFVLQGGNAMAGPTNQFSGLSAKDKEAGITPQIIQEGSVRGQHMVTAMENAQRYLEQRYIGAAATDMQNDFVNADYGTRFGRALKAMRETNKAQVYGEGITDQASGARYEYAASVRPDGSTLMAMRMSEGKGQPYQMLVLAEIDKAGKIKDLTDRPDLKEFGISNPAQGRLPLEPRPAFTQEFKPGVGTARPGV